ncbi:hypothetical protein DL96DRAFT_998032 [Flagelloscypha sp. PMI_526]|nr:hypothetical protein DL96DRAFT_998032 [Flagelloscypha sp. PMI_526]
MTATNLSKPVMLRGYPSRSSPVECTLLEALLATLSDAQILPPVSIGESVSEYFVATTTGRCNPSEALLEEIPAIFETDEVSVIVSIGSGRLFPVSLGGQSDFTSAVLALSKSCHAVSQSMESRFAGHPGLFVRLDVEDVNDSGISQPGEVISHSRAYIAKEEVRTNLSALLHSLKHRPKRLEASRLSGLQPGILERINYTLSSVLNAEESRILEKLNISTDAPFTSYLSANVQRHSCTPGTRLAILQLLLDWATTLEPDLKNSLFWLYGLAGTGKTTILHDICETLQKLNLLASSYFCSMQLSSGDSKHLVPTIARHLASRSQAFKAALLSQLHQDPDLFFAALKPQFQYLLCNPWKAVTDMEPQSTCNVVVIDALDECDRGEEFLSLLLDAIDDGQLEGIRFLVTSRPVPILLKKVRAMTPHSPQVALHEVPKNEIDRDVKRYLEANLALPQSRINELVARADGLFIYASTLVKYLSPKQPLAPIELEERLEKVLSQTPERSSINPLYKQIVDIALTLDDDEVRRRRWSILHAILCAGEPPSIDVIAGLLGVDSQIVMAVVESLYSVLFTAGAGRCIYIFHASFYDFMVSCIDGEFRYLPPATHSILAQACVAEMSRSLRFNICRLESSFIPDAELDPPIEERIHRYIGDFLAYASRNWWVHTQKCDEKSQYDLLPDIERVLQVKGLFWIEAMLLLGDIRRCKEILKDLVYTSSIIQAIPAIPQLAAEGVKLVSRFDTLPIKVTSHLYLSCLALADEMPDLNHWKDQFLPIPRVMSQQRIGNQYCQAVINVGAPVLSLALCPNGERIISGSADSMVRIWDAESGRQLQKLLGHTLQVCSVAFSPDGRRIISGSSDRTLRVWDAYSGKQLQIIDGHTDSVESVAFSLDGKHIASGSEDTTVCLWDVDSGEQIFRLEGHKSGVTCVTFSPGGQWIASGSKDHTIHLWDTSTGKDMGTLDHSFGVQAFAFSPDRNINISASANKVQFWYTKLEGDNQASTLDGHTRSVASINFSPDGKRVVTGSADTTVRIWSVESGWELQKLQGHTDEVRSVLFYPDGKRIVSGSKDGTIQIWDADSAKQFWKLPGHTHSVNSVAFSPDGTHVVSGSDDKSVCLWNAESGRQIWKVEAHTKYVHSVAFSPNGKRIASGSSDKSVRIWDADSGKQVWTVDGHTKSVFSVNFSPDGTRIASGSEDTTICIWDADSGRQLQKLQGHTYSVNSVTFSPDGKRVVSGSWDETICVWDVESGGRLRTLDGHTNYVQSVAFSSNGKSIASGSEDRTIRVWDALSGKLLRKLRGHTYPVNSVAFSPDGKHIVSGSNEKTVRLWDAESGEELRKLDGHTKSVDSVVFSPDGKRIAAGSSDKTIRIWDAEFDMQVGKLEEPTDYRSVIFSSNVQRVTPAGYYLFDNFSKRPSITREIVGERPINFSSESSKLIIPSEAVSLTSTDPLDPIAQLNSPLSSNTLVMSQTSHSLRCRNDGWLVTSQERTREELKIIWIPHRSGHLTLLHS